MSILRYGASDIDVYPGQKDGEYVKYEDHIVELTALREELAQAKRTAITEIEALHRTMYRQSTELAAAEQRNAVLVKGMREIIERCEAQWSNGAIELIAEETLEEVGINPTESGASE